MVRAFKSTLEDLEDRRSIHSLRSLRSGQTGANQTSALSSLFYQNRSILQKLNPHSIRQQTSPTEISFSVPTSIPVEPLNINNINARYMDDDGSASLDERTSPNQSPSRETRI